jgi:hypothetical protein
MTLSKEWSNGEVPEGEQAHVCALTTKGKLKFLIRSMHAQLTVRIRSDRTFHLLH